MRIDIFTKLILLSIAIALWGLLLKPVFLTENAKASNSMLDVNIKQIDGKRVYGVIDMNIKEVNGKTFVGTAMPVKIAK